MYNYEEYYIDEHSNQRVQIIYVTYFDITYIPSSCERVFLYNRFGLYLAPRLIQRRSRDRFSWSLEYTTPTPTAANTTTLPREYLQSNHPSSLAFQDREGK